MTTIMDPQLKTVMVKLFEEACRLQRLYDQDTVPCTDRRILKTQIETMVHVLAGYDYTPLEDIADVNPIQFVHRWREGNCLTDTGHFTAPIDHVPAEIHVGIQVIATRRCMLQRDPGAEYLPLQLPETQSEDVLK